MAGSFQKFDIGYRTARCSVQFGTYFSMCLNGKSGMRCAVGRPSSVPPAPETTQKSRLHQLLRQTYSSEMTKTS